MSRTVRLRALGARLAAWVAGVAILTSGVVAGAPAQATSSAPVAGVMGTTSPGWDIFSPQGTGWRYGPAVIMNSDGSTDMWTCSPGSNGAADYIRYRRSTDGGHTWTPDQVVIQPTVGSPDNFSACDPGVVRYNGYYYVAYTSTADTTGIGTNNNLFVARSANPNGPFAKWNGSGWGGAPTPFVTYTGPSTYYGIGEPSLVIRGSQLLIYYSYLAESNQTRVATANIAAANWPATVVDKGVAYNRPGPTGDVQVLAEDSIDVKWVPELNRFIGVAVFNRLGAPSYLKLYQSTDGLTFRAQPLEDGDRKPYAHNIGLSGDEQGHLSLSAANFVAYAYGPSWGQWSTRLSPISFRPADTGSIEDSFSNGLGAWTPNQGSWSTSGGSLVQSDVNADPAYITRQSTSLGDATYRFAARISTAADDSRGFGLVFNKVNPTDTFANSGYTVFLRANGSAFLYKAGQGVVVGDTPTGTSPRAQSVPIRVDQSGPAINVTIGGSTEPQIRWVDPNPIFPAGWTSLMTSRATASFSAIDFSQNVADSFVGSSGKWTTQDSTWSLSSSGLRQGSNAIGVTSTATLPGRMQGAGTTSIRIKLDSPSSASSWAGVLLNKQQLGDSFAASGYQIIVRANGMLSVHRAGTGTVVPDVATGVNPVATAVDLRIVESQQSVANSGATAVSIQVYVGTSQRPLASWSDISTGRWLIGYTSLDTLGTSATFSSFAFDSSLV